jgi:exopolyphosphatase/guanosine-5'-triphosphate,3'-diphosphate pyrophosphatase
MLRRCTIIKNIFSIIDVGTNNIQLLIAEKTENIKILERKIDVSAFGKKMMNDIATPEAIATLQNYLAGYIEISKAYTEDIIIIGTSGARKARNMYVIQDWLRENYQLPLHIISGEEEALLNGIANFIDFQEHSDIVYFDVGGGSTEFTMIKNHEIEQIISLDLGIRFLENRFGDDFDSKVKYTRQSIKEVPVPQNDFIMIGIGGTATSLGSLIHNCSESDMEMIHKMEISKKEIDILLSFFKKAGSDELEKKTQFNNTGSDVITTGTMIVDEILSYFGKESMLVSDKGLQFGLLQLIQSDLIDSPMFFKSYLAELLEKIKEHNLSK